MISVTQVVQQYHPTTSQLILAHLIRSNEPENTLEEYLAATHDLPTTTVRYCPISKRHTIQTGTTIYTFSLTDDFGSHWQGRDDLMLPNVSRYAPFNINFTNTKDNSLIHKR